MLSHANVQLLVLVYLTLPSSNWSCDCEYLSCLGQLHLQLFLTMLVSIKVCRKASKILPATSYTSTACLSVWYPPVHAHAITGHSKQHRRAHTHSMEHCGAWCYHMAAKVTTAIKGNLIQHLSFCFLCSTHVCRRFIYHTSIVLPVNIFTWNICLFPAHLSTMLGSAFLHSRSSTQCAILSSLAEAVQLAMSTVQQSVGRKW